MTFVLDASVALSWCFPDESSEYGEQILQCFRNDSAIVPAIWSLEVTNALLVGYRRNRLTIGQIQMATRLLSVLEIEVDAGSISLSFGRTLTIALEHGLSAYDTAYLELALRSGYPLATADRKLLQVATAIEVPTLK